MEYNSILTITIGLLTLITACSIAILTLIVDAIKHEKARKFCIIMSIILFTAVCILSVLLSSVLKNNDTDILEVFMAKRTIENSTEPLANSEHSNSSETTTETSDLGAFPLTNCTDLIYNVTPYYHQAVSFFILNTDTKRLKVKINDNTNDYDDRTFSIDSKYYDELIDIEITAYNSEGNIIGKINVNNLYILLLSAIENIPDNADAIFVLKDINNDEFIQLSERDKLTELACLDLDNLSNIDSISNLANLEYLNLIYCDKIYDINSIAQLSKLRCLNINDCDSIISITAIGQLSNLEQLHMNSCQNISDISSLSNLKNLKHLGIVNCPKITDYSPVENMSIDSVFR